MIGKKALITGGSFGIGEALAKKFAQNGIDTLLVARTEEKLVEIKKEIESSAKTKCYIYKADLINDSIENLYRNITLEHNDVDILVNNAGFGTIGPFYELQTKREVDMVELNVRVAVELTSYFLKDWISKGVKGTIVNISSLAAFFPIPYFATYSATKSFLFSFSEAIRREVEDFGIRVITICPGGIKTEFQKRAGVPDTVYRMQNYMDVNTAVDIMWNAIVQGKSPYIPGLLNRIYGYIVSLIPKSVSAKAAKIFMKRYFKK